jgi:hypothetical protein
VKVANVERLSYVSTPYPLLVSLSVKVVVTDVFGTPSTGVNESARSSLVIVAAVPVLGTLKSLLKKG